MADEKEKKTGEKSMENEKLFSLDYYHITAYFRRHTYLLAETAKSELTERKLEKILEELKDGTWKEMDF